MSERTTKSIRITEDAQRLLRLVAAFEDRTEGAIVEDALAAYLQIRSLGYESVLPEARELAHTTPEDVGETVAGSPARSRKRSMRPAAPKPGAPSSVCANAPSSAPRSLPQATSRAVSSRCARTMVDQPLLARGRPGANDGAGRDHQVPRTAGSARLGDRAVRRAPARRHLHLPLRSGVAVFAGTTSHAVCSGCARSTTSTIAATSTPSVCSNPAALYPDIEQPPPRPRAPCAMGHPRRRGRT